MTNKNYFEYLKKRSALGQIYRFFWLYPILNRHLNGLTLDIGCGVGDMLHYRKDTIGVDINGYNIKFCKDRGYEAYMMQKNKLPFKNHSFDSILLDNVLEHIKNPQQLLKEIKRTLRPGGIFIVGVPGIKGYKSDQDHKIFYDEFRLKKLANESGFDVNKFIYTPLFKSKFLSHHFKQYCVYSIWK